MTSQSPRIQRNYRNQPPTRFHEANQRARSALADKTRFPDTFWGEKLELIQTYCTVSDKHDGVYHEAKYGSKLVISQRDILQAQLVTLLDQIVSFLEMAAVRDPEILLASGFDLTKERRGGSRTKAAAAARMAENAESKEGESGTQG